MKKERIPSPIHQRVDMEREIVRIIARRMNEIYIIPQQVMSDVLDYLEKEGWLKDRIL